MADREVRYVTDAYHDRFRLGLMPGPPEAVVLMIEDHGAVRSPVIILDRAGVTRLTEIAWDCLGSADQ